MVQRSTIEDAIWELKDIYHKIDKCVKYLVLLWTDDYDWDHVYLWKLMAFKLKRMEERFISESNYIDTSKIVPSIRQARFHLERLIKDEYQTEELATLFDQNPRKFSVEGDMSVLEPMSTEAEERFLILMEREEQQRKDDLEAFAKLFVKNSRTWWT